MDAIPAQFVQQVEATLAQAEAEGWVSRNGSHASLAATISVTVGCLLANAESGGNLGSGLWAFRRMVSQALLG